MTAMIMCVHLAIKSGLCLTCGVAAILKCPDILLSLSHNLQLLYSCRLADVIAVWSQ